MIDIRGREVRAAGPKVHHGKKAELEKTAFCEVPGGGCKISTVPAIVTIEPWSCDPVGCCNEEEDHCLC